MTSRFLMLVLVTWAALVWASPTAEAGWLFGRRGRSHSSYSTRYRSARSSRSSSLHMTHSRSAIVNGFFGPGPGAQGVDSSWYVGR
jgi:hypothetical protein